MCDLTDESRQIAAGGPGQEQSGAAARETGGSGRRLQRVIAVRSAAGLSIAGLAAAGILGGVASTGPASAAGASSGSPPRVTTVTQTTSSAAGNLMVTVRYQRERRELKLLSVRYSGSSAVTVKHPSLIFVFAPSGPPFLPPRNPPYARQVRPLRQRLPILVFRVTLKGSLSQFSGSFPARMIASVNRHGGLPRGEALRVSLASVFRSRPGSLTARVVMQDGLILTPGFFVGRQVAIARSGAISTG